jgi:prepilin-type N-terminal cleavage/methylation domain-containing protein
LELVVLFIVLKIKMKIKKVSARGGLRITSGFTLFELLVSISIIAVVTGIAAVSFGPGQGKARDNRRVTDAQNIQIALEMYRQEKGNYPIASGNVPDPTEFGTYLKNWPIDPDKSVGTSGICYKRDTDFKYTLYIKREYTEVPGTFTCGTYNNYNSTMVSQ